MRSPFILSLGIAAAAIAAGATAQRGPDRPNVILILADDLGYATLGCYGNAKVKTPNVDRLAAEGTRFTAAYAPNSLCTPTRYALLTGEYAWRGPTGPNVVANVGVVIAPERFTLPRLFQQSGYATAGFGKWNLGLGPGGSKARTDFTRPLAPGPRALGFDHFFGIPVMPIFPPHVYFENEQLWNADPADPLIETARGGGGKLPVFEGARAAHFRPERVTTELTERLCAFIRQNREKPFFIYYPMTSPHDPFTPDPRFHRDGPWGLYGAYIEEMDWSVGAIMEALEKSGVARDTLVIFTSDNGGISAQGGHLKPLGINPNGSLRGAKGDVFEGGIRVPFVLRWPGVAPAGVVSNQPLQLNDCLASFASLLGRPLGADAGADSFDLLPAFRGKTGLFPERSLIFQGRGGYFGVRQGDWKYCEVAGPALPVGKAMRTGKPAEPDFQLFNLAVDPGETNDVRTRRPEMASRLAQLLAEARTAAGTRVASGNTTR